MTWKRILLWNCAGVGLNGGVLLVAPSSVANWIFGGLGVWGIALCFAGARRIGWDR